MQRFQEIRYINIHALHCSEAIWLPLAYRETKTQIRYCNPCCARTLRLYAINYRIMTYYLFITFYCQHYSKFLE